MLGEGATYLTVCFEDAEWFSAAAQDDVDGALDPVPLQKFRGAESGLSAEVVRDDRLPGMQSIAGRRAQIGANGGNADDMVSPANPGADQEATAFRYVLENLAKGRFQAECHQSRCLLQKFVDA